MGDHTHVQTTPFLPVSSQHAEVGVQERLDSMLCDCCLSSSFSLAYLRTCSKKANFQIDRNFSAARQLFRQINKHNVHHTEPLQALYITLFVLDDLNCMRPLRNVRFAGNLTFCSSPHSCVVVSLSLVHTHRWSVAGSNYSNSCDQSIDCCKYQRTMGSLLFLKCGAAL